MPGAEIELIDMIFYYALQVFFLSQGENTSVDLLKDTLKKYGYNDAFFEAGFLKLVQILTRIVTNDKASLFSVEKWKKAVQDNSTDAIRKLY